MRKSKNKQFVEEARAFARGAHRGQTYGDGSSYFGTHLADVANVLEEFGFTAVEFPEIMAAGWLHDVVEDTPCSLDSVHGAFGPVVADIVWRVTEGTNRRERHERTYPKLNANRDAVIVKLADRIANVRRSVKATSKEGKLDMYQKEWLEFQAALRIDSDAREVPLWLELDRLLSGS